MDTRVKYYSTCVTWNFTREVHIYTLREMWSKQTRDVNSISLCRVSLRVQACGFEVIIEVYCIYHQTCYLHELLHSELLHSILCTMVVCTKNSHILSFIVHTCDSYMYHRPYVSQLLHLVIHHLHNYMHDSCMVHCLLRHAQACPNQELHMLYSA